MGLFDAFSRGGKYFGKSIEPRCEYCEFGKRAKDGDKVLCSRKGLVNAGDHCPKFTYSPLKRIPVKQMKMVGFLEGDYDEKNYDDEETTQKDAKAAPKKDAPKAEPKKEEPAPAAVAAVSDDLAALAAAADAVPAEAADDLAALAAAADAVPAGAADDLAALAAAADAAPAEETDAASALSAM